MEPITKPAKVKASVWPVRDCHQRPSGLREPSATRKKNPRTVGGSTMGKATAASTRNFQRRREKAIQYAIGSPNAKSVAETTAASCSVSQNACQSMAISSSPAALFLLGRRRRQTEAITTEYLCRLRSLNIVHKSGRQFLAPGAGNNHQTLVQRRISLGRNLP